MKRGAQLRRVAMKRHPSKKSKAEFSPEVREQVERRSGGRCEAGVPGVCWGKAVLMHHIRRRWHGEGTAENALHLCTACHTYIHSEVAESETNGWLIRSGRQT